MSSEAITRNDLKAVLDEVLPVEPSEYRKLLWSNPSPTSSFVAQTITVPDISKYDDLEIVTRGGSATTGNTFKYPVAQLLVGNVHWLSFIGQGATGLPSVNGRPFNVVSSTQIHFELGGYWNTAGNSAGLATSGVPLKIYGIKYESVAPPQTEYYTPKEFETAWNTHSAGYYTANCVQIGDLKIQWGILQAQSGSFHSVYFKVPFEGLGYYAMASYTSNADVTVTPGNNAYITGQHTDYCRIRTNGGVYCWLCIGY